MPPISPFISLPLLKTGLLPQPERQHISYLYGNNKCPGFFNGIFITTGTLTVIISCSPGIYHNHYLSG
nr:hypothetical protein [uncultured Methanospirillum sp.]